MHDSRKKKNLKQPAIFTVAWQKLMPWGPRWGDSCEQRTLVVLRICYKYCNKE